MAGLEALELTNQAIAQQVEVTNCIEDLVLHEFVFIAKAVFVQYAIGVDHNSVFNAAAECEVVLAQVLDVTHETKGTGAADFFYERSAGKIHACTLGAVPENRVIEIDLEAHLEPFERDESGALVAVFHCHFTQDADEFLGGVLFFQACRLNQKYEGSSAAIHDRNFGRGELDVGVIDAQASHGREQVLYRVHFDVTVDQCRRHSGFANVFRASRNLHHRVQVGTNKHDAGVDRRRLEGQVDLLPGVQTYTCGTDNIFQCALFNHGLGRFSANCELVSTKAGDDSRPDLC
ncbi:hypothetical protein D3C84_562820 [compost metagenome]